jgi:tRNA pseudouridine13 synthase
MDEPLPFLTSDLPGTGGEFGRTEDDFLVEEIPLYALDGAGDHVWFRIEKRGIPTDEAVRRLARALGRPARDFGCAGRKDARAVTRQWLSLEHADPARLEGLVLGTVRVLEVARHRNKLKKGHLAGNRFTIVLRGVRPEARERAQAVLRTLSERGMPNFFGPQRFGALGQNHLVGAAALAGNFDTAIKRILGGPADPDREDASIALARRFFDEGDIDAAHRSWPGSRRTELTLLNCLRQGADPAQAWRRLPRQDTLFMLNSLQSALFNQCLARRVREIDRLWDGDLAFLHGRGAVFAVPNASAEQQRCRAFEISPSGPMFGHKMIAPDGLQAKIEADVLAASGISPADFAGPEGMRILGERRPLRVPLNDASVDSAGEGAIAVLFSLPAGSYATVAVREITKNSEQRESPPDEG